MRETAHTDILPDAIEIDFTLPPGADPQVLRPWLAALGVESGAIGPGANSAHGARVWFEEVLRLALALMHVLRVPLFEPPEVFDCVPVDERTARWRGICGGLDAELLPRALLENLLQAAFGLAAWARTANPAAESERERFFATIERAVLRRCAAVLPRGTSTFPVLRAAHALGIPYRALPEGAFQLGWGSRARRIDRSTTDRDSALGYRWTRSKRATAQLLRAAGLPVPVHAVVRSAAQAREAAGRLGFPVVVKPADRERGRGVTVDVDAVDLEAAFERAVTCSPTRQVLVERRVPGVCHRFFVVAGRLLYAVRRLPPGVYGDGHSPIRALVDAAADAQRRVPPWSRTPVVALNDETLRVLAAQDWRPESIPPPGCFIALRRAESPTWGGTYEDLPRGPHPANVRAAETAAVVLGLEIAGVDFISPDIAAPWDMNGAAINEVNYAPQLGVSEVSRRYLAEYLERLLENRGRIPLHVFIGGADARRRGAAQWAELRAAGHGAWWLDESEVRDGGGRVAALAPVDLRARVRALLMRREVEALVVVARSAQAVPPEVLRDHATHIETLPA